MANHIKYDVGQIHTVNGGDLIVLERLNTGSKNRYVKVQWLDDFGYIQDVRVDTLKTGSIRNPYQRTVEGIGYLGVGVHDRTDRDKYNSWASMIARCYRQKLKDKYPTYEECYSTDDWHCYQTYADFYESCPYRKKGWNLDKDLLVPGNKLYSPDTCVYLPSNINTKLFYVPTKNKFGLKGVWYDSQYDKWMATVSKAVDGRGTIGRFKTKEEASSAVLRSEHKFFCRLAEEWGGKLDPRAIQGLLNLAEHRRGMILT